MSSYIECPICHKVSTVYPSKIEGEYVCMNCIYIFDAKDKEDDKDGYNNESDGS